MLNFTGFRMNEMHAFQHHRRRLCLIEREKAENQEDVREKYFHMDKLWLNWDPIPDMTKI